jgi:hypothetical protein
LRRCRLATIEKLDRVEKRLAQRVGAVRNGTLGRKPFGWERRLVAALDP